MEVQAEDVELDGDCDEEEEEEGQEVGDPHPANLSSNDLGIVGVTWFTVHGSRSASPFYTSEPKLTHKSIFKVYFSYDRICGRLEPKMESLSA